MEYQYKKDLNKNIFREYDIRGIQYHPESVLTKVGKTILKNWLQHK